MRTLALLGFFALTFAPCHAQAATPCVPGGSGDTVCLGLPCGTIGQTMMDGNNENVIACLACTVSANDPNCPASGQEWKAMSNNSSIVCPAGQVITGITNGAVTCASAAGKACPNGGYHLEGMAYCCEGDFPDMSCGNYCPVYGYSYPASPDGTEVGGAVCANGTWYCSVLTSRGTITLESATFGTFTCNQGGSSALEPCD
jgi:hypothetical protein